MIQQILSALAQTPHQAVSTLEAAIIGETPSEEDFDLFYAALRAVRHSGTVVGPDARLSLAQEPRVAEQSWILRIIDIRMDVGANTFKGAGFTTAAAARASLERMRALKIPAGTGSFLLDLHAPNGDLMDTVELDVAGFTALTGEAPEAPEVYAERDRAWWQAALAQRRILRRT